MTKKIVHVTTIEQWKSVLDVWFAQGYTWLCSKGYREDYFRNGSRQLRLNHINKITSSGSNLYSENYCIEYADFMEQQEKTMTKETYYVTQEQLDLIGKLKSCLYPLHILVMDDGYKVMNFSFNEKEEKALLRYLGGDTSVEFKAKEQLYWLWRIDDGGNRVYMQINGLGTPIWTTHKDEAFTAPREEIEKWKTPAWNVEEAN